MKDAKSVVNYTSENIYDAIKWGADEKEETVTPYTQDVLLPKNSPLLFTMLDAYKTDEDSFEPYVSTSTAATETPTEETTGETEDEEETEDTSEDETTDGFYIHQGEILETYNFYNNFKCNYDDDYTNWKGTGKIKFWYNNDDLKKLYKGVRCLLKFGRFQPADTTITVKPVFLCYITDLSFDYEGNELTIEDEGRLLEEEGSLTYSQMLRSEILKEVIRTAGLTPEVDFTGLQDEVIDWTSKSSSGSDTENDGDASQSGKYNQCSLILDMTNDLNCKVSSFGQKPSNITKDMYAKIGSSSANYASISKGKSAAEVIKSLRNGRKYYYYECNKDKCASDSYNNKNSRGINCGDSARLVKCCMDLANVNCIMIHCPGHFYNAIQDGGTWKTVDLCYSSSIKSKTLTNEFGV